MGAACLQSKPVEQETIFTRVQKIIENNDIMELGYISQTLDFSREFSNINNPYYIIKEFRVNLLGLAL